VHDSRIVRGTQTVGDLPSQIEQLARRIDRRDRSAFHELHDQVIGTDVVKLANIRMIQRCGPR
jgi:hypothetical protein